MTYYERLDAYARTVLAEAMREAGGNRSRAAVRLGIERTYLQRLIRQKGLLTEFPPGRPGRPAGAGTRRPRRCGLCRLEGHTYPRCPVAPRS